MKLGDIEVMWLLTHKLHYQIRSLSVCLFVRLSPVCLLKCLSICRLSNTSETTEWTVIRHYNMQVAAVSVIVVSSRTCFLSTFHPLPIHMSSPSYPPVIPFLSTCHSLLWTPANRILTFLKAQVTVCSASLIEIIIFMPKKLDFVVQQTWSPLSLEEESEGWRVCWLAVRRHQTFSFPSDSRKLEKVADETQLWWWV